MNTPTRARISLERINGWLARESCKADGTGRADLAGDSAHSAGVGEESLLLSCRGQVVRRQRLLALRARGDKTVGRLCKFSLYTAAPREGERGEEEEEKLGERERSRRLFFFALCLRRCRGFGLRK